MNVMRRKSALNKIAALTDKGVTFEEAIQTLEVDQDAAYTPEEIAEIREAAKENLGDNSDDQGNSTSSDQSNDGKQQSPPPPPPPGQKKPEQNKGNEPRKSAPVQTLNKVYEEWKVKPFFKTITNDQGDKVKIVDRFEKDAAKPIRVTNITERVADELNSQSENTLLRLYLPGND